MVRFELLRDRRILLITPKARFKERISSDSQKRSTLSSQRTENLSALQGRAADLNGASVLIDRTPRRHKASASPKAGTAVALITDHERTSRFYSRSIFPCLRR